MLKRRGAIKEKERIVRTIYLTEKGKRVVERGIEIKDEIVQLTPEIIKSREWEKKDFRKYDVKAFAPSIYPGKHHPMMQLMSHASGTWMCFSFPRTIRQGTCRTPFTAKTPLKWKLMKNYWMW